MLVRTMDPNIPMKDDGHDSVRKSTDIPSHGTMPKWLEDISQWVFGFVLIWFEGVFGFSKIVQSQNLRSQRNKSLAYNLDVKSFFEGLDRTSR